MKKLLKITIKIVEVLTKIVYYIKYKAKNAKVGRKLKKEDKKVLKAFSMVSQVGLTMITPVLISGFIGLKLDEWFSTGYWFVIFLIMGVLAAFRSLYFLTRQFFSKDLEKERAEQEYYDSMKREREKKRKQTE